MPAKSGNGKHWERPAAAQGGAGGFPRGGTPTGGSAGEITAWGAENYTATTVDDTTVYDLVGS